MTGPQLSVAFFLQMFVILAVCRVVGTLARRIGRPQVVGEMIAGVLLGPSLFGLFFPNLQKQLFPPDSLKILYVGAQLGVGLYMFLVGVEFKRDLLASRVRSAAAVSVSGMLAPFALGTVLALWLIDVPGLFSMMVLMAIVTTLMASPVFELVYGRWARQKGELGAAPREA